MEHSVRMRTVKKFDFEMLTDLYVLELVDVEKGVTGTWGIETVFYIYVQNLNIDIFMDLHVLRIIN